LQPAAALANGQEPTADLFLSAFIRVIRGKVLFLVLLLFGQLPVANCQLLERKSAPGFSPRAPCSLLLL